MSWAAVIVGGASLVTGALGNKAAKDAAKDANAGAQAGIDEQRRQFDTFQGNIQPYLQYGQDAIGQMAAVNAGDYSGFMSSPDYLYALQSGTQQLDRGATAQGNLWGGGADADRIALGQGLATQNFGNYINRLQGAVETGRSSAVGAGQLGQQSANQISGLYGNIGQNNAQGAINQANAWGSALGGVANAAGSYLGGRQSSYAQPQQLGNMSGWGQQAATGPGSIYNFGGQIDAFRNYPNG